MSKTLSIIQENNAGPGELTRSLGHRGEVLASEFLARSGYRLVMANFKVPVGRNTKGVQVTGEIDVIALDGDTLCFIEVKTRRSDDFTPIITNVDARKQRQIVRTGKVFRRIFGLRDMPVRYDVVTVLYPQHAEPEITLVKRFWTEDKFRKRRWQAPVWMDFV